MPSHSWNTWNMGRAHALDQIEAAHRSVGGSGPGRRHATLQLNHAYAVLLAAQFQGFCRDLHSECVDFIVAPITIPPLRLAVREEFLYNRRLNTGNANQGSIAADFGRIGANDFWNSVDADRAGNDQRRQLLDRLNAWRNAIAHQDFDPAKLGGITVLRLELVRRWRRVCSRLAHSMDRVMRSQIHLMIGTYPW